MLTSIQIQRQTIPELQPLDGSVGEHAYETQCTAANLPLALRVSDWPLASDKLYSPGA